jgi:hypothetical protein
MSANVAGKGASAADEALPASTRNALLDDGSARADQVEVNLPADGSTTGKLSKHASPQNGAAASTPVVFRVRSAAQLFVW